MLDIGCENGVTSCLLASVWPQAQIVAVDRSNPAISAGRQLAERLGLKNVTFEEADARNFLTRNQDTFSIVVATLVMHELLKGPNGRELFQWKEPYIAPRMFICLNGTNTQFQCFGKSEALSSQVDCS